jgi:hypothetical protein
MPLLKTSICLPARRHPPLNGGWEEILAPINCFHSIRFNRSIASRSTQNTDTA